MALGVPIRVVFVRELTTGLVIGALLGALFFPFAFAVWGDAAAAAAVAISLGISCSVATLVAMALPYGLAQLGRDPAFGLGPLATVIQDLLDPRLLRGRQPARHLIRLRQRRGEGTDRVRDSGGQGTDEEHLELAPHPAEAVMRAREAPTANSVERVNAMATGKRMSSGSGTR